MELAVPIGIFEHADAAGMAVCPESAGIIAALDDE
jgi:hypothetical protein